MAKLAITSQKVHLKEQTELLCNCLRHESWFTMTLSQEWHLLVKEYMWIHLEIHISYTHTHIFIKYIHSRWTWIYLIVNLFTNPNTLCQTWNTLTHARVTVKKCVQGDEFQPIFSIEQSVFSSALCASTRETTHLHSVFTFRCPTQGHTHSLQEAVHLRGVWNSNATIVSTAPAMPWM